MNNSRSLLTLIITIALVLTCANTFAAPKNSPPAAEHKSAQLPQETPSPFFPESDLRDGQTGYALTVFQGTAIQRFGVEILGILHKINNGHDWILIKVTSGPSVTEDLNIAEGMSGSPVYINGRLVGAIAASIPFGRSPIGFVTPIADMLDAWDPDLPSQPNIDITQSALTSSSGIPVDASELTPFLGQEAASLLPQNSSITIRPLLTPVTVSGMTTAGIARLSNILSPFGMTPMAGGGMAGQLALSKTAAASLVPGAAVGFSLVEGDMDMTAIGTVTYRDKNRLIAFGHPFTDFGAIDAPMTTASIAGLIPSYQTSTKLGEPLQNVGRVFQDRPFSIGGEIGVSPHMVPVTVNIIDHTNKRHQHYHFEIIDHPLLTGPLVLQVAQQAIIETHGSPGDAVATVTTTVNADQVGRITRTNVFYDSLSIEQSATDDLDSLIRLLTSNSFYPLSIKGVDMEVSITSSHATAQVDHIFVQKTKYAPGDTVNVGVVIKPYKQDAVIKTISLKIPSSTEDGAITLQIRGGGVAEGQTIMLGGIPIVVRSSDSQGPTPANVNQLVRQYLDQAKNNDLVAVLQLPTTAVTVQGENLSLLPPTMSSVMRSSRSTGVHTARDEVKQTTPTDYVLTGSQSLTLTVAKSDTVDSSDDDSSDDETAPDTAAGDVTPVDTDNSAGNTANTNTESTAGVQTTNVSTESYSPSAQPLPSHFVAVGGSGTLPNSSDSAVATSGSTDSSSGDKDKMVGRPVETWSQDTASDFGLGKLNNATVTSSNELRLSLSLKPLSQSTSSYIWCLAQDKAGTIYAGTGDDGIIYKVDQSGTLAPYVHTGELEVTSLAYDTATGDLYAGTSPHGVIFKITPDGKQSRFGSLGDKYVTSLAIDTSRSRLYAATGGGSGNIYELPTDKTADPDLLFASPETHILSLAIDPSGIVYAGGSPDGVIYSITPDGVAKVVYQSAQPNITALAVGDKGTVYAGTSPAGLIYRITPNATNSFGAEVKVLSARPKSAISGLGIDSGGNVWASAGDSIYSVNSDNITYTYASPQDVTLLSLLVGADGSIYTGTGNTASIYRLGTVPNAADLYSGTYTSPVHDTRRTSRWGTITWRSITPDQSGVTLQTRSGDVAQPDQTWSHWSSNYTTSAGQLITSPPARYIQYRAMFTSANKTISTDSMPRLNSVSVYYLTRNEPPIVTVTSPSEGDFLNATTTLHWTAIDPDHDTLSYDLFYSSDGKTYLPLPKSATSTGPATSTQTTQLKDELDKHPEIPDAVRQQMLNQAAGVNQSGAVDNHVTTNSFDWNTKIVPDGTYQVKVVASNYQSDPNDPRTGEGYSQPFTIVNTPPVLTLAASATTINSDKTISLKGTASSNLVFIKAVQYQIDKSTDAYSASAEMGMFDTTSAPFTIKTLPQSSGPHTITVTAEDQAGNTTSASTLVVVP